MKCNQQWILPLILCGISSAQAGTTTGPSTNLEPFVIPASGFGGIEIHSIVSAADGEPTFGGYYHTGSADGTAAYDNGDGTFTILVSHEIPYGPSFTTSFPLNLVLPSSFTNQQRLLAHGGKGSHVAKWVVNNPDHATDPLEVVSGADLITSVFVWNPTGVGAGSYASSSAEHFQVLCSADLAPTSAFYNSNSSMGSQVKLYFTGEEFSPFDTAQEISDATQGSGFPLTRAEVLGFSTGLDYSRLDGGRAFAVQVDGAGAGTAHELAAFGNMNFENAVASPYEQDKTVVVLTDDDNPGQVYLYVGTKNNTGTLEIDKAGLTNGSLYGMSVNGQLDEVGVVSGDGITFHNFGDVRADDWDEIEAASNANTVTRFAKPEDVAWDTQNSNRFYFVTSGSGINPARLWRVTLNDIANPTTGGSVEILADENVTPAAEFSGFDNITCDYNGDVFIQEDGNSSTLGLSRVWKYDAAAGTMTVIAHHNPFFFEVGGGGFISEEGETSGILDLSGVLGEGWYLLTSMAHRVAAGATPIDQLNAYTYTPNAYYEESQLMVMFIPEFGPVEMGFEILYDGSFSLRFDQEAGFDYQPQRSTSGVSGPWVDFGVLIPDTGSTATVTVPIVPVNGSEEYYRLNRTPAP